MSLKHQLLAAAYHPLKLSNAMFRQIAGHQGGRLRVLLYHDIAPADEARFATQLRWLSRSWRFVTPNEFEAMVSGDLTVREDCLLLSFDDGFASNRRIAEDVLNPMGIKALFFVVSEFADLSGTADWRGFVAQYICPGLKAEEVPAHWRNMSWSDLAYLLETGHCIGSHTAHHARLSTLESVDLTEEIVYSSEFLERKLCITVEHFAYTFGDIESFSPIALDVARTRFKYIYTGMRGDNASVPTWAIRRDSIAPSHSTFLVGAFIEGGVDWIYAKHLAVYESWGVDE